MKEVDLVSVEYVNLRFLSPRDFYLWLGYFDMRFCGYFYWWSWEDIEFRVYSEEDIWIELYDRFNDWWVDWLCPSLSLAFDNPIGLTEGLFGGFLWLLTIIIIFFYNFIYQIWDLWNVNFVDYLRNCHLWYFDIVNYLRCF